MATVYIIACGGESNHPGAESISNVPAGQLGARATYVVNNTTLAIEALSLGVNSLISHTGYVDNSRAGTDAGLANAKDAGRFPAGSLVCLVPTAQGGSTIDQWLEGASAVAPNVLNYFTLMVNRINAAKNHFEGLGHTVKISLFWTLGINDQQFAGTSAANYKSRTEAFFASFRTTYGATTPIVMTYLMAYLGAGGTYTDSITAMVGADAYLLAISTYLLPIWTTDTFHWNYNSLQILADRFLDALFQLEGQAAATAATFSSEGGEYATDKTITLTGTTIRYTTDGTFPHSGSPLYTTPLVLTQTTTLRTATIEAGKPLGYAHKTYTLKENLTVVTWTDLAGAASQPANYLLLPSGTSGGLTPAIPIAEDGILVEFEIPDLTSAQVLVFGVVGAHNTSYVHLPGDYVFFDLYLLGHRNIGVNYTGLPPVGLTPNATFPLRVRCSKVGNDFVLEGSMNGGISFDIDATYRNVLDPAASGWTPITQVWGKAYRFSGNLKIQARVPVPSVPVFANNYRQQGIS